MKKLLVIVTVLCTFQILSKDNVDNFGMSNEITHRYKQIDITHISKFFKDFFYNKNINKELIELDIKKNTSKYSPPELFAYAHYLFSNGKKDDATFWFLFADLRGTYDTERAIDDSVRAGYNKIKTQYGFKIRSYMMRDITKLKKTINKVIMFDEEIKYEYNHEWINLHSTHITDKSYKINFSHHQSKWKELREISLYKFENKLQNKIILSNTLMGKE